MQAEDSETVLTERDRQRVALRRSSPLPVPFRAAWNQMSMENLWEKVSKKKEISQNSLNFIDFH